MGRCISRAELQSQYKRIKHLLRTDPDITTVQLLERFNIASTKLTKLKKEVREENADKKT